MLDERDEIVRIVSSQSEFYKMSVATPNSDVVSSLASNQSGLASISDDAEGQFCYSTSQISAESGAALKLRDYIGLSEVSSASMPLVAPKEEWQNEIPLPRISYKIYSHETKLTLGPSLALPSSQFAENGALFQRNNFPFHLASAEGKKKEIVVLPETKYGSDMHHTSNVRTEMNYRIFSKNGASGFEKDAKNMKVCAGIDDLGHVSQKGFILRDDHRWHVKSREDGLDLGCGRFPCLPHLYEEVGENKVSSDSVGMDERTLLDPQKQCLEHGNLTEDIKHLEKGRVTGALEEAMEDKDRRKCIAVNTSQNQLTMECLMSNKLQEVISSSKYWQPQTTVALTNVANNLTKHDIDPHQRLFPALKTPLLGTKRTFSEALGAGSTAINAAATLNSRTANEKCESQVYNKHSIPPLFPWNPSKDFFASWGQEMEHSGRRLSSFPSRGQTIGHHSPGYHSMTSSKGSVGHKLSDSELGDGLNDEGATHEVDKTVMVPRTPVGWPPVQSFRKNCLPPSHPKTIMKTEAVASPPAMATNLHVKVHMDGVPIGRKVDLRVHDDYDKLSLVLEDMFKSFIQGNCGDHNSVLKEMTTLSNGRKMKFFGCSDYFLTYEDKDGDLMLVGDVPWRLFTSTVKRLRIMKGFNGICPNLRLTLKFIECL